MKRQFSILRIRALFICFHLVLDHSVVKTTVRVNSDRFRKKGKAGGMIAENCDYGNEEPLDIVMALLIDDGIKSLGHRKNILEPTYRWIGIAIEKHKTYRVNCVMDFAEKID